MRQFEYKTIVKVVYIMSLFIQIVDGTVVNVAIPTLAEHFGVDDTDIDLAIISFLVALAVFLPTSGWLGDRFGSKPIFLGALTVFTVASAFAGTAGSLNQLVFWRIVQGAASGVMSPLGSAMLFRAYPQNERAKAATAVIGVAVIAPAVGPILGGILIETLSWRWIFYINVPIGIAALLLGASQLRTERADSIGRFDVVGFGLSGAALAALLYGSDRVKDLGLGSGTVTLWLVVGVGLLVALIAHQLRVQDPLLDLRLLRGGIFRSTNLVSFPTYMGFMSLIFIVPVYMQSLRGYSALDTGLALAPQPLGVMLSSQLAGRVLYKKWGPRPLLALGTTGAFVVGLAFAAVLDFDTTMVPVGMLNFARGLFVGLIFVALQTATYAQTSYEDTAKATTLFGMQRQLGPAIGIAVVATVIATMNGGTDTVSAVIDPLNGFRVAMIVSAGFFAVAALLTPLVKNEDAASTLE